MCLLQVFQCRLVVVSSIGHLFGNLDPTDLHWKRRKYSAAMAYANSKIANVLFAAEYSRRCGSFHASIVTKPKVLLICYSHCCPSLQVS